MPTIAAPVRPEQFREEYQIAKAIREGKATAKLLQETQRNVGQLGKFKSWLNNRAIRAKFTDPETKAAPGPHHRAGKPAHPSPL